MKLNKNDTYLEFQTIYSQIYRKVNKQGNRWKIFQKIPKNIKIANFLKLFG